MRRQEGDQDATIILNAGREPKHIDMTDKKDGKTVQGIYIIEGDTLKIAYRFPAAGRPTSTATTFSWRRSSARPRSRVSKDAIRLTQFMASSSTDAHRNLTPSSSHAARGSLLTLVTVVAQGTWSWWGERRGGRIGAAPCRSACSTSTFPIKG
jgi:hypothetical protein